MAVYTKLNQKKIEEILSNYSLGKLDSFKGIEEGIENTNYFLSIDKKKFILTIYEKRVRSADLPFFSDLMSSLNKASFKCPAPISNNNNETITNFEGKKLMIVSFLEGKAKQNLSPTNCKSIGSEIAKMHELTKNLKLKRQNDLSVNSWRKIFNSVKDKCENIHKDLPRLIEENLNDVEDSPVKKILENIHLILDALTNYEHPLGAVFFIFILSTNQLIQKGRLQLLLFPQILQVHLLLLLLLYDPCQILLIIDLL